jgi:bifunctional non-homologous end joining protein LigD
MMATIATTLPVGDGWSYEVKWDGYRAQLLNDGTRTRLISRNLKDLTADYPHIPAALPKVTKEPVLLDGEIVALDEHGRPSFQALQHRSVGRAAVVFYAFDLLHLGDTDFRSKRLIERRRALHRLKFAAPILLSTPLPGTPTEIERVIREAGLEGVVAKRIDSFYEAGIRTRNWIKVKFSKRQEFLIGGYKPAGDSFDSVLVGYYEKREFFCAGKVRAGFRPATRREVFARISGSDIAKCPFVNLPNSIGKSHWGEGITAEDMKTLRWVKPQVVIDEVVRCSQRVSAMEIPSRCYTKALREPVHPLGVTARDQDESRRILLSTSRPSSRSR